MNNTNAVKQQYATAQNLSTRISIHEKYSENPQGFGPWIVSHYPAIPGMRVLELGCGTGMMWCGQEARIAQYAQLILSDFSAGMLETAKETVTAPNVRHMVIDIQDIPFPESRFDLVIANMMLYHVPDLPRALEEVHRVLTPGGCFICATYGEHGILDFLSRLLPELGIQDTSNRSFTLQNGTEQLLRVFPVVHRMDYPDALAVTNVDDLVAYLESLSSMTALATIDRNALYEALARRMEHGVLRIPKEYGLFLCRKGSHA